MDKNEKSLISKRKIIETTYSILLDKKELNARNIAKYSGISSGLLYYHFSDLNAIIDEVIHEHYSKIYEIVDSYNVSKNYLYKFMISETLSTLYAKGDKYISLYFANLPNHFVKENKRDFAMFLKEYNIEIESEYIALNSILLMNMISSSRKAIIENNVNLSVYELSNHVLKLILVPLGIPENEIDNISLLSKELASKIKRIEFFPDWAKEKYNSNPINQLFLSEFDITYK